MKIMKNIDFNIDEAEKQLEEFNNMLKEKQDLSEKDDVLPFFSKNVQLSMALGLLSPDVGVSNIYAHEYTFWGDFRCDLIVGNSETLKYCAIEFEDAKQDSIFKRNGEKSLRDWSDRFSKGYNQIIDWFWKLEDFQKTQDFETKFGSRYADIYGLLVIGRNAYHEAGEIERIKWREKNVTVFNKRINIYTYDELAKALALKFTTFRLINKPSK